GSDEASKTAAEDETIRPDTRPSTLATLKSSFRDDEFQHRFPDVQWTITAGNSSPLTDGASAVLIMSEARAGALGLRPKARFHSFAVAASDPLVMFTGILPATLKALDRGRLGIDDI